MSIIQQTAEIVAYCAVENKRKIQSKCKSQLEFM